MNERIWYRACKIGFGATVVAAIVAGIAWGGQPNDVRRSSGDKQPTRGVSREAPPPPANRQVERQAPPQSRRPADSPSGASGSSGMRREVPVRQNNEGAAAGRAAGHDNSASRERSGAAGRLAQEPTGGGRRRIDTANQPNDAGSRGSATHRAPVSGESTKTRRPTFARRPVGGCKEPGSRFARPLARHQRRSQAAWRVEECKRRSAAAGPSCAQRCGKPQDGAEQRVPGTPQDRRS